MKASAKQETAVLVKMTRAQKKALKQKARESGAKLATYIREKALSS